MTAEYGAVTRGDRSEPLRSASGSLGAVTNVVALLADGLGYRADHHQPGEDRAAQTHREDRFQRCGRDDTQHANRPSRQRLESTRDGLRELRPGHAVRDGLEPLDRLSAKNESDVPCSDLVAPTGHCGGGDFRVVEEDP
jgi:hypothetical protein